MPKLIDAGGNLFRNVEGDWVRRGAGKHTLCERCNNNTGSWYGPAYVDWAYEAACRLAKSQGTLSMAYPYQVFRLRVIKQVVAMFFSACGPSFHTKYPDLVRFVLNKQLRGMPYDIRIFAYLVHPLKSAAYRQSGVTGLVNFEQGLKRHIFAEIAFAPFGFIMTLDGEPVGPQLAEITGFAEEQYNIWDVVFLKMPVLPVVSWLPGDFRTKEELIAAVQSEEKKGRYELDLLSAT